MKFKVTEALISYKDFSEAKRVISSILRIPSSSIFLHENGRFEIYNLSKTDAERLIQIGRMHANNKISSLTANESGYNFNKFEFKSGFPNPEKKYTVAGQYEI